MSHRYTLAEVAKWVGGVVRGDASVQVSGVAGVAEADSTQITWVASEKYLDALAGSRAGAVVAADGTGETPMPAVLCEDPNLAMVTILERFAPPVPRPEVGVHASAVVDPAAVLGDQVAIGPHVVVEAGARIGDRVVLHAGVFVGADVEIGSDSELWQHVVVRERCKLGTRVIIHPNSTIGADGYGYHFAGGRHVKIPQIGTVEIGDEVEIGTNCAVDRAKFGVTRVGAGTKIDNLVQVAHNVQIGRGCLIVGQCGIAGSSRLGDGVVVGGHTGIADHITIGDGVQVGALAGVSRDIPAGKRVVGRPAVELEKWVRERAHIHRVPRLTEDLKALAKRVESLEAAEDDT